MCKSYVRTTCMVFPVMSMTRLPWDQKKCLLTTKITEVTLQLSNWLVMLKRPLSTQDHYFQPWTWSIGLYRASDISRGRKIQVFPRNPAKLHKKTRNTTKSARNISKYVHVGKTYLILILAIRPVLFTPNVQIYLQTSSLQRVNNVPKRPGVFRWTLRKTGHYPYVYSFSICSFLEQTVVEWANDYPC